MYQKKVNFEYWGLHVEATVDVFEHFDPYPNKRVVWGMKLISVNKQEVFENLTGAMKSVFEKRAIDALKGDE